jgi:hypothetical protein
MKKKCKVVRLPTEKATWSNCIWLSRINNQLRLDKSYNMLPQHLYIISDDEVKEGDWFINEQIDGDKVIWQHNGNIIPNSNPKKIIATTDNSIGIKPFTVFPQPSPQFIQKYIDEWNKGNKIEWVNLEYEAIPNEFDNPFTNPKGLDNFEDAKWELKVDKNNYITLTKIKDNWNREEVIQLLQSYREFVWGNGATLFDCTKWIEENL